MGYTEVQYSIFKLEVLQAQEKLIAKQTGGKTRNWVEYCKICGDGVPVDDYAECDGSLLAEKEEKGKAKRLQKKAKASIKPEAAPAPKKPTATVTTEGTRVNRRRNPPGEERGAPQGKDFLRNKPSPGAVTRDAVGTISRSVAPRTTGNVILKLLNKR